MSPTILIERGYRVVVYRNDHLPVHVHVYKAEAEARVKLEPVELWDNDGFSPREIRHILSIVEAHRLEILDAWNSSHLRR